MIAQMTQAQELQLVQGGVTTDLTYGYTVPQGAAGYVPGIPAVGIPELYLADGSVGVGNGVGPATALPSSIASAASWDTTEATKYGTVIGTGNAVMMWDLANAQAAATADRASLVA